MRYNDFRDMSVWQLSFEMLQRIYDISKRFPDDERFCLTSDIRRAANSVSHNIAEGFGRYEAKDKTRFYKISRGSCYEIMSQILVVSSQNYITKIEEDEIIKEYKKIISELNKMIKTIEQSRK